MPDESVVARLFEAAVKAQANAYAPHSRFPVGAALLADDGAVYVGCNVENAAFPVGACAEAGAISAMVAAGGREIEAILVVGPGEALCPPCGACRQRIREFATDATPVLVAGREGVRARFTMIELLPAGFELSPGAP